MEEKKLKEKKFLIFPFVLILLALMSTNPDKIKQIELSFKGRNEASLSKVVDPSTADNYKNVLGQSTDGGRYAGRVWTDKSVYANDLTDIDGINGANISLEQGEDFLLSFSALGSSRILKGQSNAPIDLTIVIDTSSSMGAASDNNSDISKTIVATNNLLDTLMALNKNNRVSIVLFDNDACVLAPLNHYNKNGTTDFLTATGPSGDREIKLNYLDENGQTKTLSAKTQSGTNLQHGLTLGYEQLLNVADNDLTVTENGQTYARVPALIVLSDGESNRAYNGEDWWHPSENDYHGGGNSGANNPNKDITSGVIRSMKPLMTASYLNKSIEEHYNQKPNVYTIGVGLREIRAKIALDPETYVISDPSQLSGLTKTDRNIIDQVYNNWFTYKNTGSVTITNLTYDSNGKGGEYTFKTPTTGTNITSLNYVNKYYDISNAGELDDIFTQIVSEISSLAFHPVTDITGTSQELDITYVDPLGEYMDVKNVKALTLFGKMYVPTNNTEKEENGIKTTTYYFAETDIKHPSYVNDVRINLNDIKVEVIEDATGMVTLKIGIPEGALPLRLETVTLADNKLGQQIVESYVSNSKSTDSLPLRIFYSVGIKDSIKIDTNNDEILDTIDLNKVSKEYKEKNTNDDGTVNFYSNLYTGGTTGNANVSFGPSQLNRYYYFQKNRIIYSNPNGKEGVILDGTNNPGLGYTPVTNINDLKDDENYYLVIDYYRPLNGVIGDISGEGEYVNYIVERTGAELKNSVTYYNPETNEVSDTAANDYVVATKVGGVRLGRLNRFTETKQENSTETAKYAYAPEYVSAEADSEQHFNIALGNNGTLKIGGGNLKISKQVDGLRGNKETEFTFIINLKDANDNNITGTFNYAGSKNGTIEFTTENDATITLKHDESITIYNLPNGAKYTVTEKEANKNGYITTSENENGIIPENSEASVNFINTKNTGDLSISKTVSGNAGDTNKEFHFTVTLTDEDNNPLTGSYEFTGTKNGVIKSGDEITLKHNQSIKIIDLPLNTNYTVRELEANNDGYVTTMENETGSITANTNVTAAFTNTKNVGNLTISKKVAGNGGDLAKDFHFIVTFENDNNSYNYEGSKNGTIKSGDTITLKHNQSITINNLPTNTKYTVTETEANEDGYVTTSTGNEGTITTETVTAEFINTKNVGNLTISKKVAGNGGDLDKDFHFTVTFENDNNSYNYEGSKNGTIKSGDEITLKHNESITIKNILVGTNYTVTETEANKDGYITTSTGTTGTITTENATAEFTNTKNVGSLTITKTVVGNVDDLDVDWNFNIILQDKSNNPIKGEFTYTKTTGENGTIEFAEDGSSSITIKHGESITINSLPTDTKYTVTEIEANQNGYVTTSRGNTGTITTENKTAAFTNTKELGTLIISKTVSGNAGDLDKEFHFTVTLTDKDNNPVTGSYKITGSNIANDTIDFTEDGTTITLKHGESIIIHGIEAHTEYKVVEVEANQNGYTTKETDTTGEILAETNKEAAFINTKEIPLGDIKISKTVSGIGDTTVSWLFKVILKDEFNNSVTGSYKITRSNNENANDTIDFTAENGATIALKHGESITIHGIKEGTNYTIEELGANTAGYITTMENETGQVIGNKTITVQFNNHIEPPVLKDLTISKEVTGNGGDLNRDFHFTVIFNNDITYTYTKGNKNSTIKSGDTITLKHGESITIHDIEEGTLYNVIEAEANSEGYKTTSENNTGTMDNIGINVKFINERNVGDLTILKEVTGNAGDLDKDFHFIVTFENDDNIYNYDGSKNGTIKSGDTITLKHGESITIHGINEGTLYNVIEVEANSDGYKTTSENNTGAIVNGENTIVTYTNNKDVETTTLINPNTSDTNIILYFALLIVSMVGLCKGVFTIKQN